MSEATQHSELEVLRDDLLTEALRVARELPERNPPATGPRKVTLAEADILGESLIRLFEQFETLEERYFVIESKAILHDDAMARADRCDRIVEEARKFLADLLGEEGVADTDALDSALAAYPGTKP